MRISSCASRGAHEPMRICPRSERHREVITDVNRSLIHAETRIDTCRLTGVGRRLWRTPPLSAGLQQRGLGRTSEESAMTGSEVDQLRRAADLISQPYLLEVLVAAESGDKPSATVPPDADSAAVDA